MIEDNIQKVVPLYIYYNKEDGEWTTETTYSHFES